MGAIYSKNFATQPNANPFDPANWTTISGTAIQVLNGVCQGTATGGAGSGLGKAALTGPTFPLNQYAQFTVGTLTGASGQTPQINLYLRNDSGLSIPNGGFKFSISSAGAWALRERISGTINIVDSGTTSSVSSGDLFTVICNGNLITGFQNNNQLFSYTDTAPGSNTTIGFEFFAFDSFFAAEIATATTFAAGSGIPIGAYSQPDCRNFGSFPNQGRTVQGTVLYDVQTSSNSAVPGTDSRTAGAPQDCRVGGGPQNSRTPGTFGPGE